MTSNSASKVHTQWGVYCGQSHRLHDAAFREEVLAFARTRFSCAAANIQRLIDVLTKEGYRFVEPSSEWIEEIEQQQCIRDAFSWAGFPGFAYQGAPVVGFVARLRAGLEMV